MRKKQIFIRFLVLIQVLFLNLSLLSQNVFSADEKKMMLSEHNFYRNVVGSNNLQWSDDLEFKAVDIVNQIVNNPIFYSRDMAYGINIYRSVEKPNPVDIVGKWADEQKYYAGDTITRKNLMIFQHYTQIIWKQTVSIGCAMDKTKGGTYIVVCVYFPKGNSIGQKP